MEQYKLPSHNNPDKVFIVNRSEIEERFDPQYFSFKKKIVSKFVYPTCRLKDYFLIRDGDHDKLPEEAIASKGIGRRYLRAQDLKDFEIVEEKPIYVSEDYFNKQKRCQIFPNDLLISIMASIGLNVIVPNDFDVCIANRAIGILRLKKATTDILSEYVQILINTNVGYSLFEIEKKGGIQQRLNLSDIANVKIPVPSLDIQQQIVALYQKAYEQKQLKEAEAKALLDGIDSYLLGELGITLPKKDNSLQNRVFTTQFSEITGGRFDAFFNQEYYSLYIESTYSSVYKNEKLKNLISFIESGSRPTGGVSNIEGGILSLGGEHVNSNCEIEIKNPKYIPIEFHEKIKNTETKLHDILLVKDGATTGKTGIIEDENYVCQNINEHVFLIRTNENVNSYFFAYMLHSNMMQIQIGRGITGATVTGLTKDVVKNLQIPLPPFEKQNEIAQHIHNIREQAKQLQNDAKTILEQAKQEVELMILE